MTEVNLDAEPTTIEEMQDLSDEAARRMDAQMGQMTQPKHAAPTLPVQQNTDILYAYSVLMTVAGEVRIIKSEHIAAVREPATSDIIMTARYIHDTLRSNGNGSTPSAP